MRKVAAITYYVLVGLLLLILLSHFVVRFISEEAQLKRIGIIADDALIYERIGSTVFAVSQENDSISVTVANQSAFFSWHVFPTIFQTSDRVMIDLSSLPNDRAILYNKRFFVEYNNHGSVHGNNVTVLATTYAAESEDTIVYKELMISEKLHVYLLLDKKLVLN